MIEDPRWEAAGIAALAERAAQAALAGVGRLSQDCEIALLACDDARIAELNRQFRGKAVATNVLSWPAAEADAAAGAEGEPVFLGDLALAYSACAREAAAAGLSLSDHAVHLIVHGVLHLLGYDHDDDAAGRGDGGARGENTCKPWGRGPIFVA